MRQLGDEYVLIEHLMLSLSPTAARPGRPTGRWRTHEELLKALAEIPGRERVSDQNPEEVSGVERFGLDLTEAAAQNKLDPVIGRDDENRRVVQVLSRPHKTTRC